MRSDGVADGVETSGIDTDAGYYRPSGYVVAPKCFVVFHLAYGHRNTAGIVNKGNTTEKSNQ